MTKIPSITLNTGAEIPQLGFGVWEIAPQETTASVATALEAGYRHIDTAAAYDNESEVGVALAESGIGRDELFVTTKLWNKNHGSQRALAAFDESLEKLGLAYVDLYLIHWPVPAGDKFVETWLALEEIAASGRAKAVGVSNFTQAHLQQVLDAGSIVPAVNQIEIHPLLVQQELRDWQGGLGIHTESWSPLAQSRLQEHEVVTALAAKYDATPAQVLLRWNLQQGNVVLTRSRNSKRIRANLEVTGFELAADELASLSALDQGSRGGPDPETFNLGAS